MKLIYYICFDFTKIFTKRISHYNRNILYLDNKIMQNKQKIWDGLCKTSGISENVLHFMVIINQSLNKNNSRQKPTLIFKAWTNTFFGTMLRFWCIF